MNPLDTFLHGSTRNNPVAESGMTAIRRLMPSVPDDYMEFLRRSNGAEGAIGRKNYLVLWPAEEIEIVNDEYGTNEFALGLVLIGSDGGNTGYGFDCRTSPNAVVEIPLVAMNWDEAKIIAPDFASFIGALTEEE